MPYVEIVFFSIKPQVLLKIIQTDDFMQQNVYPSFCIYYLRTRKWNKKKVVWVLQALQMHTHASKQTNKQAAKINKQPTDRNQPV